MGLLNNRNVYQIKTFSYLHKVNSNTSELIVYTSCYSVLTYSMLKTQKINNIFILGAKPLGEISFACDWGYSFQSSCDNLFHLPNLGFRSLVHHTQGGCTIQHLENLDC